MFLKEGLDGAKQVEVVQEIRFCTRFACKGLTVVQIFNLRPDGSYEFSTLIGSYAQIERFLVPTARRTCS
jgi:hypothetical protein